MKIVKHRSWRKEGAITHSVKCPLHEFGDGIPLLSGTRVESKGGRTLPAMERSKIKLDISETLIKALYFAQQSFPYRIQIHRSDIYSTVKHKPRMLLCKLHNKKQKSGRDDQATERSKFKYLHARMCRTLQVAINRRVSRRIPPVGMFFSWGRKRDIHRDQRTGSNF